MDEGEIEGVPPAPDDMHYQLEWAVEHLLLRGGFWFSDHENP